MRKHWEWKAGVRVGVDAEMESESWGGWGGARGRCGNVRQGGDEGVWEGVVEQEVTEEFDKEGSGADRGVEMEWPQVGAKNGRQGRRHCGGGWGGSGWDVRKHWEWKVGQGGGGR